MTSEGEFESLHKGRRLVLLLASFFGLGAGLCSVFALLVTAAKAWQDHIHSQWPEASAQVQVCDLDVYTHKPDTPWRAGFLFAPIGRFVTMPASR
jgi:hypothetical protein